MHQRGRGSHETSPGLHWKNPEEERQARLRAWEEARVVIEAQARREEVEAQASRVPLQQGVEVHSAVVYSVTYTDSHLGLVLETDMYGQAVVKLDQRKVERPGSHASQITVGDMVIGVNDESVESWSFTDTLEHIRELRQVVSTAAPITLWFAKVEVQGRTTDHYYLNQQQRSRESSPIRGRSREGTPIRGRSREGTPIRGRSRESTPVRGRSRAASRESLPVYRARSPAAAAAVAVAAAHGVGSGHLELALVYDNDRDLQTTSRVSGWESMARARRPMYDPTPLLTAGQLVRFFAEVDQQHVASAHSILHAYTGRHADLIADLSAQYGRSPLDLSAQYGRSPLPLPAPAILSSSPPIQPHSCAVTHPQLQPQRDWVLPPAPALPPPPALPAPPPFSPPPSWGGSGSALQLYRTCRQCRKGPVRVFVDPSDGRHYCEECWVDYQS
jgi:hypothetical protein